MKAHFYQRLVAYIIDVFILGIIISILGVIILPSNNVNTLRDEAAIEFDNYIAGETTNEVYVNRMMQIYYDIDHETIGQDIIQFTIYVLYFIVFQFRNNGQTIGKKIMKIKIVKNDKTPLTTDDLAKRSLIINGLLFAMITLLGIITLDKVTYFGVNAVIGFIQLSIIVISAFMVLYRKDGRGIQDLFAGTKVIIDKGE